MPIHNPDALRPPRVLTQTLAAWLGVAPSTVRAYVERGVLPKPETVSQKVVLHDVAAVLAALVKWVPHGAEGYRERKAAAAARRSARAPLLKEPALSSADVGQLPHLGAVRDQVGGGEGGGETIGVTLPHPLP